MQTFTLCVRLYMYVSVCIYLYICVYDARHDIQIPCTQYVAIKRLYLYNITSIIRTLTQTVCGVHKRMLQPPPSSNESFPELKPRGGRHTITSRFCRYPATSLNAFPVLSSLLLCPTTTPWRCSVSMPRYSTAPL